MLQVASCKLNQEKPVFSLSWQAGWLDRLDPLDQAEDLKPEVILSLIFNLCLLCPCLSIQYAWHCPSRFPGSLTAILTDFHIGTTGGTDVYQAIRAENDDDDDDDKDA